MSSKFKTRQFVDPRGIVAEDMDGNGFIALFRGVPTASAAGYSPGCLAIDVTNGNQYRNAGTAASATWQLVANGSVAGARTASGVATVTGTATVATGLTTVTSIQATMQADASLTNGIAVTATIGDQAGTPAAGSVILKVWKPTASGDVTPVASAAAVAVNWFAVGT